MLRMTSGIVLVTALLIMMSVPHPPKSEAAAQEVCNASGKVANLDFTLRDMNGKDIALNTYKGKVILLDFWATWCAPCKIEIPGFIELYNTYKSRGLVVLGVSMDDSISSVKAFAAKLKMNYPVLIGTGRDDLDEAFGPMPGLPTTFIIGRDGKICGQHTGFAPKEQFEREIKALL